MIKIMSLSNGVTTQLGTVSLSQGVFSFTGMGERWFNNVKKMPGFPSNPADFMAWALRKFQGTYFWVENPGGEI